MSTHKLTFSKKRHSKVDHGRAVAPNVRAPKSRPDPREYVAKWLTRKNAIYSYGTDSIRLGSCPRPLHLVVPELVLDAGRDGYKSADRKLEYALTLWLDAQRKEIVEKFKRKLAYNPKCSDEQLRRWVRAVTGDEDLVVVAVMKHFIWQVKRKLHGLKVEHHLMPVLQGRQGAGKSEAVKAFLQPVGDLVDCPNDLTILRDERQSFRQTRYYVTFCDEMAEANRNVEALKNRISAELLRWRRLGHNSDAKDTNNSTFIGATNYDIRDLIVDPTGMRRFFQIVTLACL